MDDTIVQHLLEIKATLATGETRLENIERAVLGAEQPGLVQKVESLEASRNKMWGVGAAITAISGIAEFLWHRYFSH